MVSNRSTPLVFAVVCVCDVLLLLIYSCTLHCLLLTAWSRKSPLAQQIHRHRNLQTPSLQSHRLYSVVYRRSHGRVGAEGPVGLCFWAFSVVVVVFSFAMKVLPLVVLVVSGSVLRCLLGTFQLPLDLWFFSCRSLNLFSVPDVVLLE